MSAIAKKMNVTVRTLYNVNGQSCKEGYALRRREKDRRVVYISPDRKRRTGISSSCGLSCPDDRCGDPESGER